MGKVQLLSQSTMFEKATIALANMAGKVENLDSPCRDTVEAINEVIKAAKSVRVYGKSTKLYKNPNDSSDPKNGSYCTVPVRYSFGNRKVRECAETIQREKCKAQCSTPYPPILRACIRKVVKHIKEDFPEDFIKVTVIPGKLGLKIARRAGSGENKGNWFNYEHLVSLPNNVLDVAAFKVPDHLELGNLPKHRGSPDRRSRLDRMSSGGQSPPDKGENSAG
jgi:hypothetical protein